jgi:hypothetical protein
MKQMKILTMALMAMFALTGLIAAAASAQPTLPSILPLSGPKNILESTSTTGASRFGNGVLSLHGTKGKGSNSANGTKLGSFKELYESVTGPLGEQCTGSGNPAGTVETTGTFHVRDYKNSAKELKTALIFLTNIVKIECKESKTKIEVKGCVAAALTPEGQLTKSLLVGLSARGTENVETIKTVLNEANTAEELCELLSKTNEGACEQSSQTQTTELSEFKSAGTATEVLVMPL